MNLIKLRESATSYTNMERTEDPNSVIVIESNKNQVLIKISHKYKSGTNPNRYK